MSRAWVGGVVLSIGLAGCAGIREQSDRPPAGSPSRTRARADAPPQAALSGYGAPRSPLADANTVVLRLGERRVYVLRAGKEHERQVPIASFRVAIGRADYPTPVGRFTVIEKVEHPTFVQFDWDDPSQLRGQIPPGPNNPLGSRWVGFASVDGWKVGFHGTPRPELIGQAVSHGCVRMREEDVTRFYQLVDVGTAVLVTP